MDIRNFFGKVSATKSSSSKAKTTHDNSCATSTTATTTNNSKNNQQKASKNADTNKKSISSNHQSSKQPTTSNRVTVKDKTLVKKRRLTINDDDDDDDEVVQIDTIQKSSDCVDLNSDNDDDCNVKSSKSLASKRKVKDYDNGNDNSNKNTIVQSPQKKLRSSPRAVTKNTTSTSSKSSTSASINKDSIQEQSRRRTPRSTTLERKRYTIDDSDDDNNNNDKDNYEDDYQILTQNIKTKGATAASPSPMKVSKSLEKSNSSMTPATKVVSSTKVSSSLSSSQKKSTGTSTTSAVKRKSPTSNGMKRAEPLQPEIEIESFDINTAQSSILDQYTFVLSGILESLHRDDAQEMIKVLGGRITTAVSSKTDYLIVGSILEDGRPYTDGSKYKKAIDIGTVIIVQGEKYLYGLFQQYNNKKLSLLNKNATTVAPILSSSLASSTSSPLVVTNQHSDSQGTVTTTTSTVISNPYAKKPITNPYASKNPYAKKPPPTSTSNAATASSTSSNVGNKSPIVVKNQQQQPMSSRSSLSLSMSSSNLLWVDKYKPTCSSEILGNQDAVRKLKVWLDTWEQRFNNQQSYGKSFSAPNGPWKAALLSGPPGIGKTTTATLVAKESGRDVIEFNASDVRSKKAMQIEMGDIGGSCTIEFKAASKASTTTTGKGYNNRKKTTHASSKRTKRCIIMDEVDGMGAGDRSGIAELIQMIKHTRVPIICICNDRQNQKLKSLIPYCMDLKYRRPVKSAIASRAIEVAQREGLEVERNAAEAIVESCGNDVRQVLNCLHMWASNKKNTSSNSMTYKDLKDREHSINKDEILRVSLFDATRVIVEGRRGLAGADMATERSNFFQRNDAFFVDYSFIGLMVHQNYLKVMQGQYNEVKRTNDDLGTNDFLRRMSSAADTMSDFAQVENSMRGGHGWSLLPFTASLAVKTGFHAGGDRGGLLPGFPEFTTWLGRNSTKGKKVRLLKEIQHHMNYSVSGSTDAIRMSYLPVLREQFLSMLTNSRTADVEGAITLMDEYGLDRDDIFEKLDEFKMDPKGRDFSSMDSKMKAAFTRTYNQGVHKSQALVAEQGGGSTSKKSTRGGGGGVPGEATDLDAIDDDKIIDEEEDDDDEEKFDEEKVKAMFKKKGSRSKSNSTTAATSSKGKQSGTRKRK